MLCRCGLGAAGDQAARRRTRPRPAAARGSGPAPARPAAAAPRDLDDDAAGPAGDVGAAHGAQVGADQPGACARGRPARRRASAARPSAARPPAPGSRRSAPGYRGPWPARGAAARPRAPAAGRRPGEEPQVRAQRAPRHAGQARRVRGEPLDHRRVQQHLRHRLQAQPDPVAGELARGPQQVLRPVPPARRRAGSRQPGEHGRLRRDRRRPPRR